MMNGTTNVGINNQNYQMAFKANGKQAAHTVIDGINDAAVKFLQKDRPIAEKRERAIRESVSLLASKLKCSYIGQMVERGKAAIERIKQKLGHKKSENEAYNRFRAFIEQEVNAGRMDADHAGTLLTNKKFATSNEANKLIKTAAKAQRQAYLEELKNTNPELYKATLMRDASMTNMELLQTLIKSFFKKS